MADSGPGKWDWKLIFSAIVALSALLTLALKWVGVFKWLRDKYRYRKGMQSYRKELARECSSLVVVGRRDGFQIQDVFVELDTAPSEFMVKEGDNPSHRASSHESYVLLGAPGAGKSTLAKKRVLDALAEGRALPFFVRLRECAGYGGIDEVLVQKLKTAGVPEPQKILDRELSTEGCVCVLDGLDEVRPQLREEVSECINAFFAKHSGSYCHLQVIVTCRKEAYRSVPLDIPTILEVRPLTDEQVQRMAERWPPGYPPGKTRELFWHDLNAAPRIRELARSPLLLVGGLMQYTQSNLGIPEERVEYLGRVARCLVADWETAQGHPPDPHTRVYERLLTRIAFHLHSAQRTDCSRLEARELVTKWLPEFGYQGSYADMLLDGIAARTGIFVVNDAFGTMVFAQFGLQEYYASLDLLNHVALEQVGRLEPRSWWREVTLLAAAQQREPSAFLESLFAADAPLAAVAVAECPTPPVALQRKAMEICLAGIDRGDELIGASVAALLRKLSGELEQEFCRKLEDRLQEASKPARLVGLALATAGTPQATNTLAGHPEVWDVCLQDAGYLSTNFENLLVDWIRQGSDTQSRHAAELLVQRLSADRFRQLINLLPTLSEAKAESLALLLIKYIDTTYRGRLLFAMPRNAVSLGIVEKQLSLEYYGVYEDFLWAVANCVPFIYDHQTLCSYRAGYLSSVYGAEEAERTDAVKVASLLAQGKDLGATRIFSRLQDCIAWAAAGPAMACAAAGCLTVLAIQLPLLSRLSVCAAAAVLTLTTTSRWYGASAALLRYPRSWSSSIPTIANAAVLAVGISLSATVMIGQIGSPPSEMGVAVAASLSALLLALLGAYIAFVGTPPIHHAFNAGMAPHPGRTLRRDLLRVCVLVWLPFASSVLLVVNLRLVHPEIVRIPLCVFTGVLLAWILYLSFGLVSSVRRVLRAYQSNEHRFGPGDTL